jgi:hypothetical protein
MACAESVTEHLASHNKKEKKMAHQFIHYETYSLISRTGKSTIAGVLAEVERVPSHSKHVAEPKKPKLIFGVRPGELLSEIQTNAAHAKDRTGKRKLPKDAKLLLAGVVSMPAKSEDVLSAYNEYKRTGVKTVTLKQYDRFISKSIAFLEKKYGQSLRSVVVHYDEEFIHAHWYCVGQPKAGTYNLDGIDDAQDAESALALNRKERNSSGALRKKVRIEAFKNFQDAFFESVAKHLGWLRIGPKNKRLTRREYVAQKKHVEELGATVKQTESQQIQIEKLKASQKEEMQNLKAQVLDLSQKVQDIQYRHDKAAMAKAQDLVNTLKKRLSI